MFDEATEAGIDRGILSATPSVPAIAIEACFVNANMLNSIRRAADVKLANSPLRQPLVSRGLERVDQKCWRTVKGEVVVLVKKDLLVSNCPAAYLP
jgi:hypothetical protein